MAAVILASEENNYFSTSALRRSHSQPKFVNKASGFHSSSSASRLNDRYSNPVKVYPDSAPSSAPSSPRTTHPESSELSWASTPASNLSVISDLDDTVVGVDPEDHFVLPQYENEPLFGSHFEDLEAPTSPRTGDSYTPSPADNDNSANTSRPGTPENPEPFVDDTAVRAQPSRHVDYLSHNWREEDIWSSWKYIISRRGDYANAERLENASWRTWMKAKNKLKTVSPETLNWLKDCDVTWLYGPLQTGPHHLPQSETNPGSSKLSRSNSFNGSKKPILKKRSMSEIMLQKSLSTSSLVKQAAAAVQAQEKEGGRRRMARPALARAATDYMTFPFSSRRMSGNDLSSLSSVDSSGLTSPSGERKHIHFNEQVEQCIAVEIRGDDDDDDLENDRFPEDSDSDDGGLTMKRSTRRKRLPVKKKAKAPAPSDNKIIAMLPSTTLKSREESPDAPETAQKHSVFRSPVISPSSSQETLRPSKVTSKKMNLVFDEDDEDEDDSDDDAEDDEPTVPAFRGLSSSSKSGSGLLNAEEKGSSSLQRTASTNSLNAEPAGMRRTPSGMFMPYEEGESSATEGIFGRVIDTVNTARDIAHVIWNVGWRK